MPGDPGGALTSLWSVVEGNNTAQHQQMQMDREAAAGRQVDLVATSLGSGGTVDGQANCAFLEGVAMADWAISRGQIPYVTWTPGRLTANNSAVVEQVVAGQRDGCIDAIATRLASKSSRIMLRPFHEFDFLQYHRRGDGTTAGATHEGRGQMLVDAWRYVVNRFQAAGADNVGFMWVPDEGGGPRQLVDAAYPGNTYVDWVGSDRYNHASSGVYNGCIYNGWVSFNKVFNYTLSDCQGQWTNYHDRFAVANGKPFFIGEVSTLYDAANPDAKNQWFADVRSAKDPTDSVRYMENLIGVNVFDVLARSENNRDWRIDSNQTASMAASGTIGQTAPQHGLDGWVEWVNDPRWNVGVAP